jgi:hypothetical protein
VQVLTTGHWPYYKNFDTIVLPAIMQRCTQVRSKRLFSGVMCVSVCRAAAENVSSRISYGW